jgi:hypothetical protein
MSPQVKPGGVSKTVRKERLRRDRILCARAQTLGLILCVVPPRNSGSPPVGCLATWLHHAVTKSIGMCLALTPPVGAYKLLLQPVAGQVRRHHD